MSPLSDTDGEVGRVMQPPHPLSPYPPPTLPLTSPSRQLVRCGQANFPQLDWTVFSHQAGPRIKTRSEGGGLQLKTAVCVGVSIRGRTLTNARLSLSSGWVENVKVTAGQNEATPNVLQEKEGRCWILSVYLTELLDAGSR